MKQVELLAPAGNRQAFIGAINAGADAIYLSGKRFGAREYADNFTKEELVELIEYAHVRGVMVYVTINTLVWENELEGLLEYSDFLVVNHVDALIVQDLGVLSIFTKRYLDTEIHVSTQMNTHNIEQLRFLKDMGASRVILARETSIDTIAAMRKEVDIDLEVFVHGALCIAYSGNCLFSSMHGGRSGNRGQCAQSCRMRYSLYRNESLIEDESYLLSAKDLMTIEHLYEIISSGVVSLKIEGRMRRPEYVIATVRAYREAIDNVYQNKPTIDIQERIKEMATVFNREYTEGYLLHTKPYDIVNTKRPNHQGILVGKVIGFAQNKAKILLYDTLRKYDGIRILGDTDIGGEVSRIIKNDSVVDEAYVDDVINIDLLQKVQPGSYVMKTRDIRMESEASHYLDEFMSIIPLKGHLRAKVGYPVHLKWKTSYSEYIESYSEYIVQQAKNAPQTKEQLLAQISKLGGTPFYLDDFEIEYDDLGFIPNGVLNQLRRDNLEQLVQALKSRIFKRISVTDQKEISIAEDERTILSVKVETIDQYKAALEANADFVYLSETIDIKSLKSNEYLVMNRIASDSSKYVKYPRLIIRDIGGLHFTDEKSIVVDWSMNVTNSDTVRFLLKHNVQRIALSLESTFENTKDIIEQMHTHNLPVSILEHVVYGRADLMLTKYCPITKSEGVFNEGCNLCQTSEYGLLDQKGNRFPLKRDGYCNIRVLHSKVLNLMNEIDQMKRLGIKKFRLDFTIEDFESTITIIKAFQNQLKGNRQVLELTHQTQGRFYK